MKIHGGKEQTFMILAHVLQLIVAKLAIITPHI